MEITILRRMYIDRFYLKQNGIRPSFYINERYICNKIGINLSVMLNGKRRDCLVRRRRARHRVQKKEHENAAAKREHNQVAHQQVRRQTGHPVARRV